MTTVTISKNYFHSLWLVQVGIVMAIYFFFVSYKVVPSFIWLLPVGSYIAYSYIRDFQNQPLPSLAFTREVSGEYFFQSAEIHVSLRVHNTGESTYRGEIVDMLPSNVVIIEGNNRQLLILKGGEMKEITYKFTHMQRGKFLIGPVNYMYHSTNEKEILLSQAPVTHKFTIVPLPMDISTYPTVVKHLRSIGGPFPSKLTGEGWSFSGIRDYFPTDSMKWINWKATARFNKLQTNEYELQRSAKVLIVLDLADEPSDILEQSIRMALGLCYYLVSSSCKVGLITIGRYVTYFPPTSSRRKLVELSEHLTTVQVGVISNRELFRSRIKTLVSKLQSDHEVLVFSSLTDKFLTNYMIKALPMVGHTTIFTPDYANSLKINKGNLVNETIRQLFILNRSITTDKIMKQGVKVVYWNPDIGLVKSTKRRRGR